MTRTAQPTTLDTHITGDQLTELLREALKDEDTFLRSRILAQLDHRLNLAGYGSPGGRRLAASPCHPNRLHW